MEDVEQTQARLGDQHQEQQQGAGGKGLHSLAVHTRNAAGKPYAPITHACSRHPCPIAPVLALVCTQASLLQVAAASRSAGLGTSWAVAA